MSSPIRISSLASAELTEAVGWYESKRRGLGGELLDEVAKTVDRLSLNPETGSPISPLACSQAPENRCGCSGSTRSISIEGDAFGEEQRLQPLFLIQRSLDPEVCCRPLLVRPIARTEKNASSGVTVSRPALAPA